MALTASFSAGQNPLTPSSITLVDTSTGTDVNVVRRIVYVTNNDGDFLVPSGIVTDYFVWPYADSSISVSILDQDTACNIEVQWQDVSDVALYTVVEQFCFSQYTKQELYYLVQLQGLTPNIPSDANYNSDVAILWATLLGAINAVEQYDDIAASQNCLDRCFNMIQKQELFF